MSNIQKQKIYSISLLKQTQIFFYSKKYIIVKGPRGKVIYKKNFGNYIIVLKNSLIMFYQSFALNASKNESLKFYFLLQNLMYGVHFFFSKKLLFVGIGVKLWLKKLKNNDKVLLIKIGFSQDLYIKIPKTVIVFPLKYNLLLIRGLNKDTITQFTSYIRSHKKPDLYKGKGIQYIDESLVLKTGKKN